jgi:hypothetical protein
VAREAAAEDMCAARNQLDRLTAEKLLETLEGPRLNVNLLDVCHSLYQRGRRAAGRRFL